MKLKPVVGSSDLLYFARKDLLPHSFLCTVSICAYVHTHKTHLLRLEQSLPVIFYRAINYHLSRSHALASFVSPATTVGGKPSCHSLQWHWLLPCVFIVHASVLPELCSRAGSQPMPRNKHAYASKSSYLLHFTWYSLYHTHIPQRPLQRWLSWLVSHCLHATVTLRFTVAGT